MIEVSEKANYLIKTHGLKNADKVVDEFLTEFQNPWNQKKVDFYLDVKGYIARNFKNELLEQ